MKGERFGGVRRGEPKKNEQAAVKKRAKKGETPRAADRQAGKKAKAGAERERRREERRRGVLRWPAMVIKSNGARRG